MKPYKALTDEKLMIKYIQDDQMAFEEIYLRHNSRVYTYLTKRLFDKEAISEVYQNIFLKLHKARGTYNPDLPFVRWLYSICRTQLVDYLRVQKRGVTFLQMDDEHILNDIVMPDLSLENFPSLSLREKEVIERKYILDQDYQDISKDLNLTMANTRKIVSRALLKIRTKLLGGIENE